MTDTCGGCGDARHRLDLCAGCVQGLRDERDTARAEVERLTRDCADLSEMVSEVAAQRDAAREEIALMRAELDSQERAHAEEKVRWAARLRDAHRAHAELHERLAWVGHTHFGGRTCAACAAFDAHVAARAAKRADS